MSQTKTATTDCFTLFQSPTEAYVLPSRFTFPFYYEPHPLALLAAEELQVHLQTQTDWVHNFGLDTEQTGLVIGKMFGVLVVQKNDGTLGYLSAFSGKLAEENHHPKFVPPVFDMLEEGSFFNKGIVPLNAINRKIETLEAAPAYLAAKAELAAVKAQSELEITTQKAAIKTAKATRNIRRAEGESSLSPTLFAELEQTLNQESKDKSILLKKMSKYWQYRIAAAQADFDTLVEAVNVLKKERKERSAALQQQLFEQYTFLNKDGIEKSLADIFKDDQPIAGAGECAAPKLLQYAFLNGLKPIAMAEFWWGQPPKSAVRKHRNFYPACRSKCRPILGHMLEGIELDDNPMLLNTAIGQNIETVFEDDYLLLINKPPEFLSVPGINVEDSVAFRMRERFPNATGPLVVHRLDMSTSGLMLIAKSEETYKFLQRQFIKRKVKKRYVALLDGIIAGEEGTIDLPLRVDLEDRPRQLVCYEYGKAAQTHWKVISRTATQTRVHFFPITGRTHQLRVHAAHPLGLNTAIVGDDLYGKKTERLHLHAEYIEFTHPVTRQLMQIELKAEF